jgi:hypothetical protein
MLDKDNRALCHALEEIMIRQMLANWAFGFTLQF